MKTTYVGFLALLAVLETGPAPTTAQSAEDPLDYQIELVKENDSYDPGKTPALAQKLVEQDGVFALVGVIGTENNLAIRDYMNDNCVPNIAVATGSPNWGDADQYPWYLAGLPSYALEANYWVDHIAETNPDAKIALLYQDDDSGQAYKAAIEKAIERSNNDDGTTIEIVGEQGYNPLSGTTTEAATIQLSQSGADTFILGLSGTPCPQTLTFVPDTWDVERYISVTCAGNTAMSLAGGKEVARFTALVQREAELPVPEGTPGHPLPAAPRAPAQCEAAVMPFKGRRLGYADLVENRVAEGRFFAGPCTVWFRLRHPLVAGEAPSPYQRVAVAADSGNGISAALDFARYSFVNCDLTINLLRRPVGEWICLQARTELGGNGCGLAESALFDEGGLIGRATQSLAVRALP